MNFTPLEMAGIINSSELAKVMSNDLIYLAEPALNNIFYAKYFEGQLQTHYMDGAETTKMGDELGKCGAIAQKL